MKFIYILSIFVLLSITTLQAQSGYSIKMDLTGFKDGTTFKLIDLELEKVIDSTRIKDGKLTFQGSIKQPVIASIHTIDKKHVTIYLENKHFTIKGSYNDFYYSSIEGSENNTYSNETRNAQRESKQTRDSLMKKFILLGETDSLQSSQLDLKISKIDSATTHYRKQFIGSKKPTYFSIHELFTLTIMNSYSSDSLKTVFNRFPAELQNTKEGLVISSYIKNAEPQIGHHFIDIEGLDPAGKKHKLSELKGQYILLEFWASWCFPCRQENPLTVKTYNIYHPKGFQIFGFSIDANKANWIKAINKDKLTWLNISDLKGDYSLGTARYHVNAIPQNFLIDPQGIIIAKDLRGKFLEDKMKSIYGE